MTKTEKIQRTDEVLHEADAESLERRVMELALERTGSRNGAIFMWDQKANGLASGQLNMETLRKLKVI